MSLMRAQIGAENRAKIGGKTLAIRNCGNGSSFFEIYFEEGGPVPEDLNVHFTAKHYAVKALLEHFEKRNALG